MLFSKLLLHTEQTDYASAKCLIAGQAVFCRSEVTEVLHKGVYSCPDCDFVPVCRLRYYFKLTFI